MVCSVAGLVTERTCWGDVVVTPLQAAYSDKVMEPMYEDECKDGAAKQDDMDT